MAPPRCTDPWQLSSALPLPVRVGGKASENCSGRSPGLPAAVTFLQEPPAFQSHACPSRGALPGLGAGPPRPSPTGTGESAAGTTRTHHCLRSLPGWRGVPWGLVPRVTVGGLGAALTWPCVRHHLPPGPVPHCRDVLLYYVSPVFWKPVTWNAQWVSRTVSISWCFSPPLDVVLFFCSLSATLSWPLLFKSPTLLSHFNFQELSSPSDAS